MGRFGMGWQRVSPLWLSFELELKGRREGREGREERERKETTTSRDFEGKAADQPSSSSCGI